MAEQPALRHRLTLATLSILLQVFLAALDASIVGTAIPTIVASLGGLEVYSWVFTAYMLANVVAIPVFGKLSDLYGRRRFFILGILIFITGSALCGSAQTMLQLILFRGLQGLGAGANLASAITLIGVIFPPERRGRMQGMLSAVWAVASIVGPLTGGVIVEKLSWRWAFLINPPLGLVAVGLSLLSLRESFSRHEKPRIDYTGAALLISGTITLLFGLVRIADGGASGLQNGLLLSLLGAGLLVMFVLNEMRAVEPILPLALFRSRTFTISNATTFLSGMAMFGAIGFVPLYVQGVFGKPPTLAGFALTPFSLGWAAGSLLSGFLLTRLHVRFLLVTGHLLMVFGFGHLAFGVGRELSLLHLLADLTLAGVGMGTITTTITVAVQNRLRAEHLGTGSSATIFFRISGGAIGVSLMGAVMAARLNHLLSRAISADGALRAAELLQSINPRDLLRPETRLAIPASVLPVLRDSLGGAIRSVFVFGFVAVFVGLLVASRIRTRSAVVTPVEGKA